MGSAKPLTAPTLPAKVYQVNKRTILITIVEGRNRQIRKMMRALDYHVVTLHRIRFAGIGIGPLKEPGDWEALDEDEMTLLTNAIATQDFINSVVN